MDIILKIWSFFQTNILTQPAFFVGILVLLGYLLMKKPLYEAYAGFVKATVGYLILNVGAGGLVSTFRPILAGLSTRFNLSAAVIDPYFGQSAALSAIENVGRTTALTMVALLVAFVFNILLVALRKITKCRTVFITGHIMVQQSTTALWLMMLAFPHLADMPTVVMLGLLLGAYWSVSSNLTVEATQNLTDGGGFAVGHQQMFGVWFVDKLAPKVDKKRKKLEDMELPGFLSIFNDNVVATGSLMLLFFGVIILLLGKDLMATLDPSAAAGSFIFYIIRIAFTFAVYLSILQLGVRMFVAELTESFTGISEKLLPGSMPAIDCAATYGFGHPNAVTFGFLFGAIGQFIAILGLVVFKSPILIITGFVPVFFDNGTFAVFANKKGGFKAVAVLTFCSGIIQVLGGALCASLFQTAAFGGWHGNFDMSSIWLIGGLLLKNAQWIGFAICMVVLLAIPQLQYRKNKEYYFLIAEDYEAYKEKKGIVV